MSRVSADEYPGAAAEHPPGSPILQLQDLLVEYTLERGIILAVDRVSFEVGRGEFIGIVGESACGKSTLLFAIAQLAELGATGRLFDSPPHPYTVGLMEAFPPIKGPRVPLSGAPGNPPDLARPPEGCRFAPRCPKVMSRCETTPPGLYRAHGRDVRCDPFGSISPVYRVSHGVMRSLKLHRPELGRQQRYAEAERVFELVGLTPGAEVLQRYPHELGGGQRQRVGFAQALAMRPKLILADEPVSMLDASIRTGLVNLMVELRDAEGVSVLYTTHDLASARYVADRLIIMYARRQGGRRHGGLPVKRSRAAVETCPDTALSARLHLGLPLWT